MIVSEIVNDLSHHYSDRGMVMRQVETGNEYDDAWDIVPCPYTYEETDKPIEQDEEADFSEAGRILLGVEE